MNVRNVIISFLLVTGISAKAQPFADAVSYNDYVVNIQTTIAVALNEFNQSILVEGSTRETVEPFYNNLITVTNNSLSLIKAMPAYNGDSTLRDAASELFEFYHSCFTNEYATVMTIVFDPNMTMDDYNRMNNILTDVSTRESVFDLSFQTAQYLFAIKNGFTLEENEMQKTIDNN
ncbi:MAG TPA: hypothetical protein PKN15_11655 [Chitinophagales bacterium]|nr:hypothetical protein [Chitinophagales bacterium]HNO29439.1 hypothetical protein [Chitinophagales bacterium]